jgi:hypothetical protein
MKKLIDEIENKSKIKYDFNGKIIKYDFNCKHYFGIIFAKNEEEAKKILHNDHTGNGNQLCNWSKTTKNDCQINCKLNLKKR